MSAADVSGVLALMQDFFVNHSTLTSPSPALLKAMLINGARPTGAYDLQVHVAPDVIEQLRRVMFHVGENQNLLGLRSKDFRREF